MKNSRMKALAFAVAAASCSQMSFAQLVLEEVIVTAQKKPQSLTEAPLTVNLMSSDDLNNAAIFDASELGKLTSGVEIRFEGDSNSGVGIRGVGTFATQSAPPRVATYMDGYFIGSQQDFAFASMYDMKQVQILRGPQGTLYGQPSPAGALIMETADPSLEAIEGFVKATYQADPQGYNVQAGVSIPIIENVLGARISVLSDDRESGIENVVRDGGFDEERGRDGVRIKVLWEPTDSFSANLGYSYLRTKNSDTYVVMESTSPDSDFQLDADDRTSISDQPDVIIDKKDFLFTANLAYEADWGTVTYFIGDFGSENLRDSDNDATQYPELNVLADTRFNKNVQQELRILMSPTDNWETQFGVFHQNSDAETSVVTNNHIYQTGVFEITLDIPTKTETSAIFTHNDFFLTENTTLTVGARYNVFDADNANTIGNRFLFGSSMNSDNEITDPIFVLENPLGCVSDPSQAETCELRREKEDKEWTGTVKLAHSFSDELNMYATIDHGFRPGAPNFDVDGKFQPTPEDPDSGLNFFEGETVDSIEVGVKGDIMGGRGQFTSAVFFSVYEDYQLRPTFEVWNAFANSGAGGIAVNSAADVNVDEAQQIGAEFELRFLATENLELFGSVTWAKVELTDGEVPCTDPSQEPIGPENRFNTCDADGEVGTVQPEWYATFSANYTVPLDALGGVDYYLNGLVNYKGDIEVAGDTTGELESDGYTTLDVFTGLRGSSWELQLYLKNALDDDGVLARRAHTGGASFAEAVGGVAQYNELSVIAPRSVGVTASYFF